MTDFNKIERSFLPSRDGKCVKAPFGMVAAAFPQAAQAGVNMLEMGGNAVDAACATALALAVCEPQASGVGGQTMGMLAIQGRVFFLDGSGRIPRAVHATRVTPENLRYGHGGTTVPSTIAVLGFLNRTYGKVSWAALFEPAIRIAREGYAITELQSRLQKREAENFSRVPSRSGAVFFLKDGTRPYQPGELFKQPVLAALLDKLARGGPESFYTGRIASLIETDMQANSGFLRAEDLADIPWPRERAPLSFTWKGLTFHVPPPPSPGRGLTVMLRIWQEIKSFLPAGGYPADPAILAEIIGRVLEALARSPVHPSAFIEAADPILAPSFARHTARAILEIDRRRPLSFFLGAVHTVARSLDGAGFLGAAEVRRDGAARGLFERPSVPPRLP